MSKNASKKNKTKQPAPIQNDDVSDATEVRGTVFIMLGSIALLCAIAVSLFLASKKLGVIQTLPGCGVGSGCDAVTNGVWGTIPLIGWPVSFVGVAWFVAMLRGWLSTSGTSKTFLWAVRAGVLGSLGFVIVMVSIDSYCTWCLSAHACNFVFWIVAERVACVRSGCHTIKRGRFVPFVQSVIYFMVVSVIVGTIWGLTSARQEKFDKKAAGENTKKILEGAGSVTKSTLSLLEARHRIGSPDAPIQVVMFTDYQCPDCKRMEQQLASIVQRRNDVAVSIKHFPMCFNCNDNIKKFNIHPNACWAARAAEAASIIGGEEAWQKMHNWLFSQNGSFTGPSLTPSLISLGFNPKTFVEVMKSDETLRRVKDSANDAFALGIYFTPMIFINGVEYLWYYGNQQSLEHIINAVGSRIANGETVSVVPPDALEKLVEDWRRGKKFNLPGQENISWLGEGPIEFVIWSDYQAALTKEIEREVRAIQEKNPRIRYAFRHFPIDEDCNSGISNMPNKYDGSCFLARLVEAVDVLAGHDARWAMHDWILEKSSNIQPALALAQASTLCGVDQSTVQDVTRGMDVSNRLRMDILSKNAVWRRSIPVLTIDGRFVPRWRSEGKEAPELFQQIVTIVESEMKQQEVP